MLGINLSFAPNEEDDILNTTIRDSYTGSIVYIIETPRYAGGTLTTTVTRRNQIDGSMRFAFKILWKGGKLSSEDVSIVLDNLSGSACSRDFGECARKYHIVCFSFGRMRQASDHYSSDSGSVRIEDVEYRWRSKGTGSKVVVG